MYLQTSLLGSNNAGPGPTCYLTIILTHSLFKIGIWIKSLKLNQEGMILEINEEKHACFLQIRNIAQLLMSLLYLISFTFRCKIIRIDTRNVI